MNRLLLVTFLVCTVVVNFKSKPFVDAKSVTLDNVVRALDALYRRQGEAGEGAGAGAGGGSGAAEEPQPSSSEEGGGEEKPAAKAYAALERKLQRGVYMLMNMVGGMHDYMFTKDVRGAFQTLEGVCANLFVWLQMHHSQWNQANDDDKLLENDADLNDDNGSESTPAPGETPGPATRSMAIVRRNLRKLMNKLDKRQGGEEPDMKEEGDVEEVKDKGIPWHRIFYTCYVFMGHHQRGEPEQPEQPGPEPSAQP